VASASITLGRGPIFEIVATDGIVRCSVVNQPDIAPEEGARCAVEMQEILEREVLSAESRYVGLVFDVRRGPDVFGPKTRAALEQLFRKTERVGKPIAVRIGDTAIQRLQFTSLCAECAPTLGKVVGTAEEERWARRPNERPPTIR
jgi:hypothetical protein